MLFGIIGLVSSDHLVRLAIGPYALGVQSFVPNVERYDNPELQ